MGDVTVGTATLQVFGTLAGAEAYFKTGLGGTAWLAAASSDRPKALVSATRWLLRLGVTDGQTPAPLLPSAADTGVPENVKLGAYELAEALLADASVQTQQNTGSNVKAVGAGSARVEFFRSTTDTAPPLPLVAFQLLGPYLPGAQGGGAAFGGNEAFGTCEESHFGDEDAYGLQFPLS